MIKLQIYGQPTSTYEYVKMMILDQAKRADIDLDVSEISDVKQLIEEGLDSIPTVKINDTLSLSYNARDSLNDFIQKVNLAILKEANYGNMRRIVVPTDFSETSWNAVAYAYGLAKELNGVLNLVHCYLPSAVDVNTLTENTIKEMKEEQLEEFYKKVTTQWVGDKSENPTIIKTFIMGFPVEEIVKLADEEDALIVLGSTGDTGAFKKFFGSISTTVAQRANKPVFIIPPGAIFKPVKNIAYACECDEIPNARMETVQMVSELMDSKVHLVHIEEDEEMDMYFDLIKAWKNKYPDAKVENHFIKASDVNEGLNSFVEDKEIDMLVMTHKKRGFLDDLFHKSHTKEMSINSKTPLLVLQSN